MLIEFNLLYYILILASPELMYCLNLATDYLIKIQVSSINTGNAQISFKIRASM